MVTRDSPASTGQRLLWLLDHHRGAEGALNCPLLCRLRGPLDPTSLTNALRGLADRHESLRTRFTGRGAGLRQQVHAGTGHLAPRFATSAAEVADAVRERLSPHGDLVRATVFRAAPDDHLLLLNLHHLVTDAWSNRVLFDELAALLDGRPLPPPAWQYADFTAWQRAEPQAAQREYWRRHLAGATPPPLPAATGERGTASLTADVDAATARGLRGLARQCGTTVFGAALAVYYALLATVTDRADLTVASLFANRVRPESRGTVGFLANMVLLRTVVPARGSYADLVRATGRTVAEAFVHQSLPVHTLGGDDRSAATDVVFQVLPDPVRAVRAGAVEARALVPDGVASRFDLELALVPADGGFRAVLFYNPGRVPEPFARTVLTGYTALAAAVAARPATPLDRLVPAVVA
ncbi:condensation domain-containing protein [Actinosynnema sp. NPDC020468]|uniref:condensation domain-containing protein n=1 Tax=Actinosynnema sp. NPDC020468 TaxID=3154488 RepID=UPI0033EF6697